MAEQMMLILEQQGTHISTSLSSHLFADVEWPSFQVCNWHQPSLPSFLQVGDSRMPNY